MWRIYSDELIRKGQKLIFFKFCMQQKTKQSFWIPGKFYRSRPIMYAPLIIGDYLLDIDGTNLLMFSIDKFEIQKEIPLLSKQDQYCAKLRKLNDEFAVVVGMTTFHIFSIKAGKVVQSYELESIIENIQTHEQYLTVITSDLEQQDIKLLHSWKISEQGKILKTYEVSRLEFPSYEECTEEKLQLRIIMSIDNNPRIYIFWQGTNQMIEVDPLKRHEEKYSRTNPITELQDIDNERYAEVHFSSIHIISKNGGKEIAQIINKGENFNKIIFNPKLKNQIFTFSNIGLKKWKLEKNSAPVSYESSEKYKLQELYFDLSGKPYAISTETNHILCWQKPEECTINHFPPEQIKRIIKVNETQVCLLIEATASREEENEYHVEKYNKMEIYDLEKNCEIAKKAVLKFEYKIDINSAIVSNNDTVRFILLEQCEGPQQELKKHIFRWSPFVEDKKKEVKKREIVGANTFDSIKLYSFDRIVTITLPKDTETQEIYSVFGNKSKPQAKTQICLFNFDAKKIGDYDLNGKVEKAEMANETKLYIVANEKLSIYSIDPMAKNRLQKIHELEVSLTSLYPFNESILIQRENSFTIYDNDFELIMKEEVSDYDEQKDAYRVLEINKKQFILATGNKKVLFDLDKEDCKELEFLPQSEPEVTEVLSGRLIIATKGIKAYPYHSDYESV